jgi:homoserine O-succinyltransferase
VSLLKEYRRELGRFYRGETDNYPPVPEHYFDALALAKVEAYRPVLETAKRRGTQPPGLTEAEVLPRRQHTWGRDGRIIYRNWLAEVVRRRPV